MTKILYHEPWRFPVLGLESCFGYPHCLTDINGIARADVMAKFDGIRGQELLEVEDKSERENEITLIFKDNRFLFIKLENGKMVTTSIPE